MSDPTVNRAGDSQRLTINWWLSDVASSFVQCTFVGATCGAFNPYPVPGCKRAYPLPPFSSLRSIGCFAGVCGSIVATQRFASGGMAVARNRNDVWNELAGVAAVYYHAERLFRSEKAMVWNNRVVAGLVVGSIAYANAAP